MGWRNASGRLQEMSCRKSLVQLDRRGVVELPAVTKRYAFQERRQRVCPPVAAVECGLEELGEIEILRVNGVAAVSFRHVGRVRLYREIADFRLQISDWWASQSTIHSAISNQQCHGSD